MDGDSESEPDASRESGWEEWERVVLREQVGAAGVQVFIVRWCLLILLSVPLLGFEVQREPCSTDPLNVKLPPMRFENLKAVQVLVAVSQAAHVCVGIEGAVELRNLVSTDTAGLRYLELVNEIVPQVGWRVQDGVVNLAPREGSGSNWMDTELMLETRDPQDINWVAYGLLGSQLYYRSRPGIKSGIAGSIGGSGVKVGPYRKGVRPARWWLNRIVRDAGGACWLTPRVWLKRDGPPPLDAWLVLLYRTDSRFNQQALSLLEQQ